MRATRIPRYCCLIYTTVFAFTLLLSSASIARVSYEYDARHRLVHVAYDNGAEITYGHDKVGNRLTKNAIGSNETVFEDAENGDLAGWDIYDNSPAGAVIDNVYDDVRGSRVVAFSGIGTSNGYRLRGDDGANWDEAERKVIDWSMRYSENFVVYIAVRTSQGFRYIYYTAAEKDKLGDGTYVHHALGGGVKDGTWHRIVRDLEYDLQQAQPDNELEAILGFLIRGSGRVDDIKALESLPASLDSDGDGLTDVDEMQIYSTNPYLVDTDHDNISDGDELTYWGVNWNDDIDGDGLVNLVDGDADGDGIADGVEIGQGSDPGDADDAPTSILYEDGEDGSLAGWDIYDDDPAGAMIDNVYDDIRDSRVIEFTGDGTKNGYRLRDGDATFWQTGGFPVIEWSMRYDENFVVYIAARTSQGFRYIYYTAVDTNKLGEATYIHHGLGRDVKDGNWHRVLRDLEFDLKEAQPDNEIEAVLGFLIRGSGRVDDIKILDTLPADLDSDNDGLSDIQEMQVYGSHPYRADTDGDTMADGEEVTYWDTAWNSDIDGDGLVNLLDVDADGDGVEDGVEIDQGTDPGDAASVPTVIVYEDGEDGNIAGWDIYDDTPGGAAIDNVYDDVRGSRVIEFTGDGTTNGYRLRNHDFSYWLNSGFTAIEWSMRYSESAVVYIAAQTSQGFRYIYYTTAEKDNLGDETYVHHGLGSAVKDGTWHTLTRDLEADLKEAQPDNELESVLGFFIRGSGRVDNILLRNVTGP